MTSDEAKRCLYSHNEVICNGINYERMTAIIYRLDESGRNIIVSAELLDKSKK